jgi:hypothetical protein
MSSKKASTKATNDMDSNALRNMFWYSLVIYLMHNTNNQRNFSSLLSLSSSIFCILDRLLSYFALHSFLLITLSASFSINSIKGWLSSHSNYEPSLIAFYKTIFIIPSLNSPKRRHLSFNVPKQRFRICC